MAGAMPIAPKIASAIVQFPSRAGMNASTLARNTRKTRNGQLPSDTGRGNENSSLPASALTASPQQQQRERAQAHHVDRGASARRALALRTEVARLVGAGAISALRDDEPRVERLRGAL